MRTPSWIGAAALGLLPLWACTEAPRPVEPRDPRAAETEKAAAAARAGEPVPAFAPPEAVEPAVTPTLEAAPPETIPEATLAASEPAPAPVALPAAEPGATAVAAPTAGAAPTAVAARPGVVVLDPGEGENRQKTLVETARAERERRAHAGRPKVVITNKTLPKLATGTLTYAVPKPAADGEAAAAAAAATAATDAVAKDEAFWRSTARELRTRWRDTLGRIEDLEQSTADLRRRFYSEDDPYRRDGQIKPEWDRQLDRLATERQEAKAVEQELAEFLEEGRREGALPGWLREGSELQPPPQPASARPGQAVEPKEKPDYAIEPPELQPEPEEGPP